MTVESIATFTLPMKSVESSPEAEVIDLEAMKAILYLGIRGEIHLPIKEQHTIDTFA
jgi:hypothetical protein